ncbi:hypothetical protein D477_002678 [Arthrobacter crystallopoietes BAB-32]|uniref:Uncharacterized protein n=1 Tax=Arthrobacter crystallopoietes BAB-32 TaxID=1246476 RepID=N1V6P2_9MICC|nr:hypothetical protein D477_002678 [Arthrobacter crystallopoietes BAB-32]
MWDVLLLNTTMQGAQLFLQGRGHSGVWADAIADAGRSFDTAGDIDMALSEVPGVWLEKLPPRKADSAQKS